MQHPTSEVEVCLSLNFRELDLNPAAQEFFRESLNGWKTLSELVLKENQFRNGRLFMPSAPDSDSPVPDFKYGGEGELAMGEYVTRLEEIVKAFLKETDGLVIFHNTTAKRGDAWIEKKEHHELFAYWNDEVYQIMHRGNLALVSDYAWDVTGSHYYRGFFCKCDRQSALGKELNYEFLGSVNNFVSKVES